MGERAEALREAADEVRIEARWQLEQKRRMAATSTERATLVYTHSLSRLGILERILRDRADLLAAAHSPEPAADPTEEGL